MELELGDVLMEHLHIGTLLVFECKPDMKANPLSILLSAACRRVREQGKTTDEGNTYRHILQARDVRPNDLFPLEAMTLRDEAI